jgi:hypothetical protein
MWLTERVWLKDDCSLTIQGLEEDEGDRLALGGVVGDADFHAAVVIQFLHWVIRSRANFTCYLLTKQE